MTEVEPYQVTLDWTASADEGGLFGCNIKLDDGKGTVHEVFVRDSKNSVTIDGLSEATTYKVTIDAIDNNGNHTSAAKPLSVKTAADTERPSLLNDGSLIYSGTIDIVRLYDRALTAEEIQSYLDPDENNQYSFFENYVALLLDETAEIKFISKEDVPYELVAVAVSYQYRRACK